MEKTVNRVKLDEEWLVLVTKAKLLGFTVEEVRLFLKEAAKEKE